MQNITVVVDGEAKAFEADINIADENARSDDLIERVKSYAESLRPAFGPPAPREPGDIRQEE